MNGQHLDRSVQTNSDTNRTTLPAPASVVPNRRGTSLPFLGIAGMIIGLPALVLFWVPALGWLLMLVGLALSVAGLIVGKVREQPVGFATAGVILNSIALTIHNSIAMVTSIAQSFFEELSAIVVSIVENFIQRTVNAMYELLGPLGALLDLLLLFF